MGVLKKLSRKFYLRPTLQVARELLGKMLVRSINDKHIIGKIVEVEAYRQNDPASHSFNGPTKRNDVMFWNGGHLYVYFTYGMHFCCNVVIGPKGRGEAVLIRAVEPLEGIPLMRKRRRFTGDRKDIYNLTNGPAKLCEAFAIKKSDNGTDLLSETVFISEGETILAEKIARSGRIGISNGKGKKWRFYIKRNQWVSKGK